MRNKVLFLFSIIQLGDGLKNICFQSTLDKIPNTNKLMAFTSTTSDPNRFPGTDLTGQKMFCSVNAFSMSEVPCGIELKENFEALYSLGISSESPGIWRVVVYDNGVQILEVTHPVSVEYMLLFDISDPILLWKGRIEGRTIVDGEIITNKKKFGIFPYKEILGSFNATLLAPKEPFPRVDLPSFDDQVWVVSNY